MTNSLRLTFWIGLTASAYGMRIDPITSYPRSSAAPSSWSMSGVRYPVTMTGVIPPGYGESRMPWWFAMAVSALSSSPTEMNWVTSSGAPGFTCEDWEMMTELMLYMVEPLYDRVDG